MLVESQLDAKQRVCADLVAAIICSPSTALVEKKGLDSLGTIVDSISWQDHQEGTKKVTSYSYIVGNGIPFNRQRRVVVHVTKGSLLTDIWNPLARFDEEIFATLEHVPTDEDGEAPETFVLWRVRGISSESGRIGSGTLNWSAMDELQNLCNVPDIGVVCFAKMFVHFLLCLPIFNLRGEYLLPQPAVIMHNELLSAESSPFVVRCAGDEFRDLVNEEVEELSVFFTCPDTKSARWIEDYIPCFDEHQNKFICHRSHFEDIIRTPNPQLKTMFSLNTMHDIGVRVVEVMSTQMMEGGLALVVEIVHKTKWVHTARFVAGEIPAWKLIMARQLLRSVGSDHDRIYSIPFVSCIQIFDELDWHRMCLMWSRHCTMNCKADHDHPSEAAVDDDFAFTVDFRNSCEWAKK